ncbi:flagellar basal body rod protein FlgC [Legionella taurinensis]|uniref:Flagellar basal-body rod protein FlgC n=1 Tax=Legionella taurinensis TaxID=70611 RepID=A0A3A5LAA8_9GAMM|nr:flagellar basal body rod protein FlgC [Legionella taurinensis]MDX1837083.1 flagellar basal body rod protein FlgC [Legionella taurinensis]PUT40430.1 flagellar basal body rod protein FlgC [Legionella taurinensis]PUT40478.1 flagellar basal body rod protein FlgC [Legionella taurinensis]PUT42723.1 flagellar basal body rod protein FlgC [Legionella taurinensis]PUT48492.1 flagellar basal body rod protein FlgC [Legionella taurinensis]
MSLNTVFDIASSGLVAETTRMSTTASNMSNANVVAGNPDDVYRPQYPLFQSVQEQANLSVRNAIAGKTAGVEVAGIYESELEPVLRYDPSNPLANEAGYVYVPNVNMVGEMANMISASRAYQVNLEVISSAKQLMQRTLQLGQ